MSMPDMTYTSGIFYAFGYWAACVLFISLAAKKIEGLRLYVVELFALGIIYAYGYLTSIDMRFFVLAVIGCMMLLLLFLWICCKWTMAELGYYFTMVFIIGEFATSLEWQIYDFMVRTYHVPAIATVNFLVMAVVFAILFPLLYFILKKSIKTRKVSVSRKETVAAVSIGLIVLLLSNMGYLLGNTPFSGQLPEEIYRMRTAIDLAGICQLFAYHFLLSELKERYEKENLQNVLEMQYKNYQLSEKSVTMINQKYHDLKHQIAVLKAQASAAKSVEYLEQMEQEIRVYETQTQTGNRVLDTVLTGKMLYCQDKDITITCVADGTALDFMDDMDIGILFGNALDNAIEAVEKLKKKEKRMIHLDVSVKKTFVKIRVENYYEKDLQYVDGVPQTTKEDKEYHGYGLKSIRSIVEKYNGFTSIESEEDRFVLGILFPR